MFSATLRYIALLALACWLGSLLFFGMVLAPVAFTVLPTTHEAGLVVGASLRHLHVIGLVCGVILFLCIVLFGPRGKPRTFAAGIALTILMVALTAISQFGIIPAMDRHRAAAGDISSVPVTNPDRAAFNRLHVYSTWTEQGVLLAGLVLLGCVAALAFASIRSANANNEARSSMVR